jgi:hypothetical protein
MRVVPAMGVTSGFKYTRLQPAAATAASAAT